MFSHPKWTFGISLFSKWQMDNDDMIKKCFDFDWEYGVIPKFIRKEEEVEKVKQFLKENYKQVKEVYKYHASGNPVGDVWALQNPTFTEVIQKINIVDNKLVTDANITIK